MIYRASEPWAIPEVLKIIEGHKDIFNIPKDKLDGYLTEAIKGENSVLFIDEKENKVVSFIYASIEEFNGEDRCFIHACVCGDKDKHTVHHFLGRVMQWAKDKGIKGKEKLMLITKIDGRFRDVLYRRKYKFEQKYILMTRDI